MGVDREQTRQVLEENVLKEHNLRDLSHIMCDNSK